MRHAIKKDLAARGLAVFLSVPLGVLSAFFLRYAIEIPIIYSEFLKRQSKAFQEVFLNEGMAGLITTVAVACGVGAGLFLIASIIGLIRKPRALSFLRSCYIAFYGFCLLYVFAVVRITGLIFSHELTAQSLSKPDSVVVFLWRCSLLWPVLAVAVLLGLLHIVSWRKKTIYAYKGYFERETAPGDRILENLRTHGRDALFRKSVLTSTFAHLMVLVIIPLLLRMSGCAEPYLVPEGEGDPVVAIVQVVKPKKIPKKHYVLNPMSSIIFKIPDFDDTDLMDQMEKITQLIQTADPTSVHKQQGKGKGGGWPGGMKNAVVRFIRLQYAGEDWDDGMDHRSMADVNFLQEFRKMTGFHVAAQGESHPASKLANYPKGYAPPFVYMTGSGIIRMSVREIEILRRYLLDGGMLFADCGSPAWDGNFRAFVRVLFPGEQLLVISDDDPIYQRPFVFANGAPPLWHHGGEHALGIKRKDRWMVYYHPGDMNDAWKTGHSGMRASLAKRSHELGVNIVYHAFTHYMEETRKYRR